MGKIKVVLGDWSQDGHNIYNEFVFKVNDGVIDMQMAYIESCKLVGVQFNYNANYTGLSEHDWHSSPLHILTEYGCSSISEESQKRLKDSGITMDLSGGINEETFCELLLQFIKLSLPELTWEEAAFKKSELKDINTLNGWWCTLLNHQFGYGLYE